MHTHSPFRILAAVSQAKTLSLDEADIQSEKLMSTRIYTAQIANVVLALIFDLGVSVLTLSKTYRHAMAVRRNGGTSVTNIMLRDGEFMRSLFFEYVLPIRCFCVVEGYLIEVVPDRGGLLPDYASHRRYFCCRCHRKFCTDSPGHES